ncbi:MAG: peptidoglycan-binding domain-containing protein [Pyrinomonadaceae bacterium]|nr:peptidoglycan-binding domain-containing protein [Pyrinomonadaceae bacterium]
MITDWPAQILNYEVERKEIKRPGGKPYFASAHSQIGVLHTTEGNSVKAAWNTLSAHNSAPHFIVGENRIVQCRPLSKQAAALHGSPPFNANTNAALQIEMVGFTGGSPDFNKHAYDLWIPADDVLKPVIAIMAWAAGNGLDIPLQVPSPAWTDDGMDCPKPWAVQNKRRLQAALGLWPAAKGWWMHMEVPGQGPTWHYDCGALKRTVMLQMARDLLASAVAATTGAGAGTGAAQPVTQPVATPTPTPTPIPVLPPSNVILRFKDVGANVKILQEQLMRLGLLAEGNDDGVFGKNTLAAVRNFQSSKGLKADGLVGPATKAKLINAIAALDAGGQ